MPYIEYAMQLVFFFQSVRVFFLCVRETISQKKKRNEKLFGDSPTQVNVRALSVLRLQELPGTMESLAKIPTEGTKV